MTHLLDANVLIALCVREHLHHDLAFRWIEESPRFAVCPITEGALVRQLFRITLGQVQVVQETFVELRKFSGYEFWGDDISYGEAPLDRIQGYKQVTDAYLVALAKAHGGRLATFDQALAAVHPEAILLAT